MPKEITGIGEKAHSSATSIWSTLKKHSIRGFWCVADAIGVPLPCPHTYWNWKKEGKSGTLENICIHINVETQRWRVKKTHAGEHSGVLWSLIVIHPFIIHLSIQAILIELRHPSPPTHTFIRHRAQHCGYTKTEAEV